MVEAMQPDITIRAATLTDASAICWILRRSIVELCQLDHRNDEAILAHWLRNKTPENIAAWIDSPETVTLIALTARELCGVGIMNRRGEILLCYVVPEMLHHGVGKCLLEALIDFARGWGLFRVTLESTMTARSFYRRHGFQESISLCLGRADTRIPWSVR